MILVHPSLSHFLLDFPRLTRQLSAQAVASATVGTIFRLIPQVRVVLELRFEETIVQSAAGLILPGITQTSFERQLAVRGINFGHLTIEFLAADADATSLAVFETLALQLALYAEILSLRDLRQKLLAERASLAEALATEKAVVRAAGVLALDRGMSLAAAERWIRVEAANRDRTALSLAEMVLNTLLPNAERRRPRPRLGRPEGEVAA